MAATGAVSYNMTNKTFLQGFANLVSTVNDPGRYANGTIESFQRSLVPRVVAQTEKLQDPLVRDARSVIDQLRARCPGLATHCRPSATSGARRSCCHRPWGQTC